MLKYLVFFGIGFSIGYFLDKKKGRKKDKKKEDINELKFFHITNEIYQ
jgi:hypothetical protein